MTWYVRSTHLETLHDGRMVAPNEEATGVDPELDKEAIDRGALVWEPSDEEAAIDATTTALELAAAHPEIDISAIKGTGKNRRIVDVDVKKAIEDLEKANEPEDTGPSGKTDGAGGAADEPAAAPQKEEDK